MTQYTRDLRDADSRLVEAFLRGKTAWEKRHVPWKMEVCRVWGSQAVQEALWAQGRTDLKTVNDLCRRAGLPAITPEANMKQVTWTRSSKHTRKPSEAIDFYLAIDPDGPGPLKPIIDWEDESLYRSAGVDMEAEGLVWGGRFRNFDGGHVELPTAKKRG